MKKGFLCRTLLSATSCIAPSALRNAIHLSTRNSKPGFGLISGGIANENRMKALAIGGTADHLHALLSLPGIMSFAKAVQLIKGGSSKWIPIVSRDMKNSVGRRD